MGFNLASRVYAEVKGTTGSEQAILAYLAFRADDKTGACFPNRQTIVSSTHFGQTAITSALNALRKKNVLSWVRGGRHAGSGGRAISNEYKINFRPSICREATEASAAKRQKHLPPDGICICREAAPIIKNHNENHNSIIRQDEPRDEFSRELAAIGRMRFEASAREESAPPKERKSLVAEAMRVCGVSDTDNARTFSKIMIGKNPTDCLEVIMSFESEIRQGEHSNAKNLAAILTKRLKALP